MTPQAKAAFAELDRKIWHPATTQEQKIRLLETDLAKAKILEERFLDQFRDQDTINALVKMAALMSSDLEEFKAKLKMYKFFVDEAGVNEQFNEAYLKVKNEKYS